MESDKKYMIILGTHLENIITSASILSNNIVEFSNELKNGDMGSKSDVYENMKNRINIFQKIIDEVNNELSPITELSSDIGKNKNHLLNFFNSIEIILDKISNISDINNFTLTDLSNLDITKDFEIMYNKMTIFSEHIGSIDWKNV